MITLMAAAPFGTKFQSARVTEIRVLSFNLVMLEPKRCEFWKIRRVAKTLVQITLKEIFTHFERFATLSVVKVGRAQRWHQPLWIHIQSLDTARARTGTWDRPGSTGICSSLPDPKG